MGKKSRRKKVGANKPFRPIVPHVARPFEGLDAEADLVAMREIIPAATLKAMTTEEYGSVDFYFATLLPDAAPAIVREDGVILVGMQTRSSTRDAAHDLGVALVAAIDRKKKIDEGAAEYGVVRVDVRDAGPRINDMLASTQKMEIQNDLGFWVADGQKDDEIASVIEQTSNELIPSKAVSGVENTYWHDMGKHFVRWIRLEDEDQLFTALARLQAAGELTLGQGDRFIGAFRACGISIPVFEFPGEVDPDTLTEPVQELEQKLSAALENKDPMNEDERRARAGLVSRQVSI
ncbi:MAG: DUF5926 family protein [Actinomycetaceae bacterium]|nr:DUF5926 family protein [Actinomycetaceae bacterium]